jgi:hypothetical protein
MLKPTPIDSNHNMCGNRVKTVATGDTGLALQLQLPFQVGFLGRGLMASTPDRPGDDKSRIDATLDQTPGNTTDLLE